MKEAVKAHGVEQVALPAMARQTYFLRFGDGGFESWDAAARLRGGEPDRAPEFRFRRWNSSEMKVVRSGWKPEKVKRHNGC